MLTVLIFLIVISVLVFVHELGHFVAAKRAGMKVEEFGLGFPPRVFSWRRGGTVYSINAIPFGGFVRIYGEDGEHRNAPGSFGHANFLPKLSVVLAGVVMNFILAAVLLMAGNFFGLRVGLFDEHMAARATDRRIQILQVAPESPAEAGGLRSLDQIVGFRAADGSVAAVASPEDVQQYAYGHTGQAVTMVVRRGATDADIRLTLRSATGPGQGPIGISLAMTGVVRYSWYESLWRGIEDAASLFVATLVGYWGLLVSLFSTGSLGADVSGPIGIAALTGQAARVGFTYLLQFVAMISVNLAVLNVLPFPALDGGRAVMVIAERIRRRALGEHVERAINAFGFAILLALMVAVTIKDIVRFF
ncbi:MAG: site-2 protease family protein [Candidatus Yanofskybacteria bacterium]|nr:site-2 protease family protein [Candidatus Yanofskybacteria bacterium]